VTNPREEFREVMARLDAREAARADFARRVAEL
jgi:hypothetical protein